jgi:hypothetical protein
VSKALKMLAEDEILLDEQSQASTEEEREMEKGIEGEDREGDEAKA